MNNRENCKKIFKNGVSHLKIANILAESKYYGSAISHIVLGIEELIKYLVYLIYITQSDSFTEEEINGIFSKHSIKHNLIKEFSNSISSEFSDTFLKYILKSITGQELNDKESEIENSRFKEIGNFLYHVYKEINLPEHERIEFIEWLNKSNDLKNKGFYVDETNNEWTFPSDIRKSEFMIANRFAILLLKQTKVINDLDKTDDELIDFLNCEI